MQALAVLTDEAARKAYDNVLKAKQASLIRNRQLDEKRKKLKDDLDAREAAAAAADKAAATQTADKKSEESLKRELERLQEEGRKQLEEEQERLSQMVREAAAMPAAPAASESGPAKLKAGLSFCRSYRVWEAFGETMMTSRRIGKVITLCIF